MTLPFETLTVIRGATPEIEAPVFLPDGSPDVDLATRTLRFVLRRNPNDRDTRRIEKTNAVDGGITVGTGTSSHVATISLARTDLELAERNRSTTLLWDLYAETGADRVPLARGEMVVLATASEYG